MSEVISALCLAVYLLAGFGVIALWEVAIEKYPPRAAMLLVWPLLLVALAIIPLSQWRK